MKRLPTIFFIVLVCLQPYLSIARANAIQFDFYGTSVEFEYDPATRVEFNDSLSYDNIKAFYDKMLTTPYQSIVNALQVYRDKEKPDDWLYYQLIRKTAQQISPKAENYFRYTLYKWFLLNMSGYDASLSIGNNRILFYVQSDENIYNIPYRMRGGKQYVCLNYHDYGTIDFDKEKFKEVVIQTPGPKKTFSYKVTHLPNFRPEDYQEKDLTFNYYENEYHFRVKVSTDVGTIFAHYPVVDYSTYFNIPFNAVTYGSLIPELKEKVKKMKVKTGVDYLMHFTRYAFSFKSDEEVFGQEKRLTPEQTMLLDNSDCDDRAGLFFYLVKEIYDLPMIVLEYDKHVTVAVKFDKCYGAGVVYNGVHYSICEPSSQRTDLRIGQLPPFLRHSPYDVAYVYTPTTKK